MLTVALVGNPNAGKTTLFNALSGLRQRVGNYSGVTVEMKKGHFTANGTEVALIDLPGTYSLAARSPDEMVAVDLLLGRRPEEPRPDVVLSIADATNLDRHLYLTTQLLELGEPVVLAVNMIDAAAAQGITIDYARLSQELGIPVVPIQANKGLGLEALKSAVLAAAQAGKLATGPAFPETFEKEVSHLQNAVGAEVPGFLTRRLLLDVGGYTEQWLVEKHGELLRRDLADSRSRLAAEGCPVPAVEARTRFGWIRPIITAAVARPAERPVTWTDRLDRVLTHKLWGTLIFLGLMFLVFQSIFFWAKPVMELIVSGQEAIAEAIKSEMAPGPLRSLLADGIVVGVGSVVIFLPQILVLFGFIAVLEDCGYMARAAFLMDRLMSKCGLSGKSFIPLLSSVACAVPGIMATRVIENRRDRFATILVAPLMSCSARLPVYILMIGAFLSEGRPAWLPGVVLFAMYMLGFTLAPLIALVLKRTLLKGETPVFVMELPAYKRPTLRGITQRMGDAGWAFLRRAGTVIFASMVIIWALLYFPSSDANGVSYEDSLAVAEERAEVASLQIEALEAHEIEVPEELEAEAALPAKINGEWKRNSVLGRVGLALEPAFAPLGWDWRIGMAAIASFPAREVIVGMLVMVYDVNDDDDEEHAGLQDAFKREWAKDPVRGPYAVPVALSIMVFIALCLQCASTLAVIYRETHSWWWPLFTFVYMTVFAYLGALLTFQIGKFIADAF